ncbi:MAG: nitroreductase family protein [Tissierellales bacterium]|jgi:nitroreductase|nr:nitroreductase family protein [Tissierellales bacterium]
MINAIKKRRSVRKFSEKKVELEIVSELLKSAMQAPSAGNQQPWEFVIIDDKSQLEALSNMSPYAKFLKDAPLAIVVVGNKNNMKFPENWEQDLGAATQNILLEATEHDLGSTWLGVHPLSDRINHVKNIINCPKNIKPYCVIAIGYPASTGANHFVDRYDKERVHYNKY